MISDNYVTGDNIYLRELQNFFFEVLGMMSITHYGAVGDGRVDNYGPLQVAIDDAHRRGLSYLYVPYGRFIYTGELINITGITFMGNPHSHIVNIRTGYEIPIHQFGWGGSNIEVSDLNTQIVLQNGELPALETGFYLVGEGGSVFIGDTSQANNIADQLELFYYDNDEHVLTSAFEQLVYDNGYWVRFRNMHYVSKKGDTMTGSLAIGESSEATGELSFAQGDTARATGDHSHAEGHLSTASGASSHAEGNGTKASSVASHAEGTSTKASAYDAHAEGSTTEASGIASHSEGVNTTASGSYAHAEGNETTASATAAHAEGNETIASGMESHAEGWHTTASQRRAHAEGNHTLASGYDTHAEGYYTEATGDQSHAEGHMTISSGNFSHSAGYCTEASRSIQTAIGKYNVVESGSHTGHESTTGALIVGNGTDADNRSNAMKLTFAGNMYIAGTLTPNGADYAEMIEWADGNPNNEDRTGKFAVIENNNIRLATSQDSAELMGVISAKPTILGDSCEGYWHGKYVTDVYGRIQYETVTIPAHTEDGANFPERTEERPIISPDYDPTREYIPREQRPEYGKFAMLGKLVVEDDGTCEAGGYCYPDDNGIATRNYEGFYVMARIDENHIKIFVR